MTADIRILLLAASSAALLAACGAPEGETEAPASETETAMDADMAAPADETAGEPEAEAPAEGTLAWAVAGEWRGDSAQRDEWRNPAETLAFLDVDPSGVVMEIWPGGGWYTQVLAPWVAANDGTFIAAQFPINGNERRQQALDNYLATFSGEPYGEIDITFLGPDTGALAEPGTVDAILSFRNVHNWMSGEFAEKAFADFHAALKPGGVLGIVEHRLPSTMEQDPRAGSGYVQQDYVIAMAEEAGFVLEEASEINANPADTADHPFGVWTLPPVARTSGFGEEANPEFDRAPYDAIGESDRMTLRFRKPAADAPAEDAGE